MAKIICHGEVYEEISLKMFHESEVQAQIASRAHIVFPGYRYAEFRPLVRTESEAARPDFILIEKEYRQWYVGEVEMVRHDLIGHVLRQVRVFRTGEYGSEHAKQAADRSRDLDAQRLHMLFETVPPRVLVIVDKMNEEWKSAIRSEGGTMAVFEVFRRQQSPDLIFRINGDLPEVPGDFLSNCHFDRSFPRLLRVATPASVDAAHGERLTIECGGMLTEWVYMVAEGKAWLNPVGDLDLPRNARFALTHGPSGRLRLEVK